MFGPLISKPRTSLSNKTGSWRVEVRPKFLKKDCIACRMCLVICPEGCISESADGIFTPDYSYCKGCGLCAEECPGEAIEMKQEEK